MTKMKDSKNGYLVIVVGCLECRNDSKVIGLYSTLKRAKEIAKLTGYNQQESISVYGGNYKAVYSEVQTIVIPLPAMEGEL